MSMRARGSLTRIFDKRLRRPVEIAILYSQQTNIQEGGQKTNMDDTPFEK